MHRLFFALSPLLLAAASAAGCNPLGCGPGTKQVQAANGEVQCVVADEPATGNQACDVDGGTVELVGGVCVSRVTCDPSSTSYDPATGVCLGTGAMASPCSCNAPGPGKICVTGDIRDFESGMKISGGRPLDVAVYEPLSFLGDPASAIPLTGGEDPTDSKGCFSFTVAPPATGIVAIGVRDPSSGAPAGMMPLATGASGAIVSAGNVYHVDAYLVTQARLASWSASNAAFASAGAYVACYYHDKPPAPTALTMVETMPASGVQLVENGGAPSAAAYLANDRSIAATATATGALGCAVTVGTSGAIATFSGTGGGVTKWESQPGASAPGVVFVARFHNCDIANPGTATCQ